MYRVKSKNKIWKINFARKLRLLINFFPDYKSKKYLKKGFKKHKGEMDFMKIIWTLKFVVRKNKNSEGEQIYDH